MQGVDASRDFIPFLPKNQYHYPTEQVHYAVNSDLIYMPAGMPGVTGYKLEPVTDL